MTWRDYTDFALARRVARETFEDISEVRGQPVGGWNAEGHGNTLLHFLRVYNGEVTASYAGGWSVAVDHALRRSPHAHSAPAHVNTHMLGDMAMFHRLVNGVSREVVRQRIEDVYATPDLPTGPISSNFLGQTLLGRQPFMTLNLPAYSAQEQETAFARIRTNGYRDVDIYAMNIGPPGDSPFGGPWRVDSYADPKPVIRCCERAHAAGLRVTLWIWSDDMRGVGMRAAISRTQIFLPALVPHVERIVCALEGDETRGTSGDSADPDAWTAHNICADPESDTHYHREGLAYHIKKLIPSDMQVFVHWTDYEIMGNSWKSVDGLYYQAKGETPTAIADEIKRARKKWGAKPVVYSEGPPRNSHSKSRVLAQAALDAGAAGSAHG